jgi:hypothetical protein
VNSAQFDENISCKCYYNKTASCSVMLSKVYSAAVVGVEAFEVEVEVHAGLGNTDKIAVVRTPQSRRVRTSDLGHFATITINLGS